jgi:UDPglucose--hexose-1-phosphate uridylyltransferase
LSTEVPAKDYDIVVFENKFPSLQQDSSEVTEKDSKLFKHGKAQGICEVVLFTSDHDGIMSEKPLSRYIKLIKVWRDRYQELGAQDFIDYVFIFENKGEEVGVTLHHPHGQIYAYPFIPPVIEQELDSSKEYLEKEGKCLFCKNLEEEKLVMILLPRWCLFLLLTLTKSIFMPINIFLRLMIFPKKKKLI